jgi:hypothetical protein
MTRHFPDPGQDNRKSYARWVAVAALSAVAIGLIFLFRSYFQLFDHITPRSSMAPSTSMEPFEINLRAKRWNEKTQKEDEKIYEWNLAIPRAFVVDETGTNGALYTRDTHGDDFYHVRSQFQLSDKDGDPVPMSLVQGKGRLPRIVMIGIANSVTRENAWIVKNDLCFRQDEGEEIAKSLGAEYGRGLNMKCDDRSPLCVIGMQLDGWTVDTYVAKDLYSDPKRVCKLAKKFLIQYTVKRDDIR